MRSFTRGGCSIGSLLGQDVLRNDVLHSGVEQVEVIDANAPIADARRKLDQHLFVDTTKRVGEGTELSRNVEQAKRNG